MPFRDELHAAKRRIKSLEEEVEALREKAERADKHERKARSLQEQLAALRKQQRENREEQRRRTSDRRTPRRGEPEGDNPRRIKLLTGILLIVVTVVAYLLGR